MKSLFKSIILVSLIISLPAMADSKDHCKKIAYVTPEQQQLASDLLMASGGIGLLTSSLGLLFSLSVYASDLTTSQDRYVLEELRSLALKISIPSMVASGLLFKLGRTLDNREYNGFGKIW